MTTARTNLCQKCFEKGSKTTKLQTGVGVGQPSHRVSNKPDAKPQPQKSACATWWQSSQTTLNFGVMSCKGFSLKLLTLVYNGILCTVSSPCKSEGESIQLFHSNPEELWMVAVGDSELVIPDSLNCVLKGQRKVQCDSWAHHYSCCQVSASSPAFICPPC